MRPADTSNLKNEDIADHVNLITPMHPHIDSSSTSVDMLDAMMAMKSGPKKPKLEEVTLSEWVVANTGVMDMLYGHMIPSVVKDYWSYTIKLGEFLHPTLYSDYCIHLWVLINCT